MPETPNHRHGFLVGGGAMGARMRAHDWAATPLGPPDAWADALRTTVSVVLNSALLGTVLWGPDLRLLYNDAYAPALAHRHPDALGRPIAEVWGGVVWDTLGPNFRRVLETGEPIFETRFPLPLERGGRVELTYWDYSVSPIRDGRGRICGLLNQAIEVTGQVLAEERHAEDEARLRRAQEAGGIGLFTVEGADDALKPTPEFCRLYGLPERESYPAAVLEALIVPEDTHLVSTAASRSRGDAPTEVEYRIRRADTGEERWIARRAEFERDGDGRPVRFYGVARDVTERRAARAALSASEARFATILDTIEAAFAIVEVKFDADDRPVDYRFVEANPAFERQAGVNLRGKWVTEFAPDLERFWFDTYGHVARTGEPAKFENYAEAFARWFDVRAVRIGDPADRQIAILFDDVTARKDAEERLRASEAVARENIDRVRNALAAGAIIGTWNWDLPSDRFTVDDAFAASFGLDLTLGRTGIPLAQIVATVHPDDQAGLADAIKDAVGRGGRYAHQYRVRRHDGRYYWLEANGHVEHGLDGTPLRFPGVLIDVEDRRAVEAERDRVAAELRALNETLESRVAERTVERDRALRRQAVLYDLLLQQRAATDERAVMHAAAAALGRHLAVDRTGFFELSDRDTAVFIDNWSDGTVAPLAGAFPVVGLGPTALAGVRRGEALVTADTRTDPLVAGSVFPQIGTLSAIGVPLLRGGEWHAGLYVNHGGPRLWLADEIALAREIAELTWDAVARLRAQAAASLLAFTDRLRDLDDPARMASLAAELMGETLGVMAAAYATMDADGVYVHVEQQWHDGGRFRFASRYLFEDYGSYVEDLRRGESVVIGDVAGDPRTRAHADDFAAIGIRGLINVPVMERGRMVAAFFAVSGEARAWTPAQATFARQIAEVTRIAVERRRAERGLMEANATLAAQVRDRTAERDEIWAHANDLLTVFDRDGVFLAANPAWARVLGYGGDDLIGRSFFDLLHPDDHAAAHSAMVALVGGDAVTGLENRYWHRDGGWRWLSWTATPSGARIFSTARDVTEVKAQAEALEATAEALRQSQKMEAVGQLTGGLAHDFNNLLAGISGSLEMMSTRIDQGRIKDIEKYMVAAQGASKRAAALTHRLLAFSRRQTLAPKPTDVNRLVGGMLDLIQRTVGPSVEVQNVGAAGLWPALVDPSQLENALLNLCINARDAMPGGGKITIETGNRWIDRAQAKSLDVSEGQYLSLCVSDTGTGMTPDVLAKATDPFFTTKPLGEGTGLGLSMIYGFARQSGGHLRIYSEVGQGTMVCVYLLRHLGEAEVDEVGPDRGSMAMAEAGETVLVVDDEPTVRMLVTDVLGDLGYTAIEAADGVGGLRVLQSDARIDLLVTDVGLPGGMNGRQMADAARVHRPDLKVLFITGFAENALLNNGQLEPGMAVLTKPFAVDTLGARIREMIVLGPGRTEPRT